MLSFSMILKRAFLLSLPLFAVLAAPDKAHSWSTILDNVEEVYQFGDKIYVLQRDRWYELYFDGRALKRVDSEGPLPMPDDRSRMPDGFKISRDTPAGIHHAWYANPTTNYQHGILGDLLEASSLKVVDRRGREYEVELPLDHVFEDRTPRLADITGDGQAEVITIRTNIIRGSQVVVYGMVSGSLRQIAETPHMGRAYEWLNIAGIADFNGDGKKDIAIVEKPHDEGRVSYWTFNGKVMERMAYIDGFSNHVSGLNAMHLSAVVSHPEGYNYLILPTMARTQISALRLNGGEVEQMWSERLPGAVQTGFGVVRSEIGAVFFAGVSGGRLVMQYATIP